MPSVSYGISSNLTVIKAMLGLLGSIGFNICEGKHDYCVSAFFQNPFEGRQCHIVICLSHHLKNIISALHSSRPSGIKDFCKDGICFG